MMRWFAGQRYLSLDLLPFSGEDHDRGREERARNASLKGGGKRRNVRWQNIGAKIHEKETHKRSAREAIRTPEHLRDKALNLAPLT